MIRVSKGISDQHGKHNADRVGASTVNTQPCLTPFEVLIALVTPVPKVPKPTGFSDFRPISVSLPHS